MAVKLHQSDEKEADAERSTEDIRQNIAKEKENISQKVEQIGERIKEKLDWREYVKDSPYWAIGSAAGLGYLASRVFKPRTTPMERIRESIAEGLHGSIGGLRAGSAGPGLVQMIVLGIATKAADRWIKSASSTAGKSGGSPNRPLMERGKAINPKVDTENII